MNSRFGKLLLTLYYLVQSWCWNFLQLNPKGLHLSLEEAKERICFTCFLSTSSRENRKFHVVVMLWRPKSYKKAWCTCKVVVLLVYLNLLLFCRSRSRRRGRCLMIHAQIIGGGVQFWFFDEHRRLFHIKILRGCFQKIGSCFCKSNFVLEKREAKSCHLCCVTYRRWIKMAAVNTL